MLQFLLMFASYKLTDRILDWAFSSVEDEFAHTTNFKQN